MFLIATRLITMLAIAYLFGLLVAWLFSLFNNNDDGGGDFYGDRPEPPQPPGSQKTLKHNKQKTRLVEVDESYYLEEFDLSDKQSERSS